MDRFLKPASEFPAQPQHLYRQRNALQPESPRLLGTERKLSLAKSFRITEKTRIDLRGEAFNILNRTIFATGSTNLNSSTFGQVISQNNDPRQMQVGLKIYW